MNRQVRVALYGNNGHQLRSALINHPHAELVAVGAIPRDWLPAELAGVTQYRSLDELLADSSVELIIFCSPRRADQAGEAVKALRAGKHVYAEKPAAITERDLDAIMAAARESGRQFHEMAGTVLQQPYREMRRQIQAGAVGTVVQVLAQKCYPWGDWRPKDEALDGGLALQVGIYPMRYCEHIAGVRIAEVLEFETRLGDERADSACRMAVLMMMRLENGGIASAVCNYLNPMKDRCWGYEILRIFGTKGIIESSMETNELRLIEPGQPPVVLQQEPPTEDYFDAYARHLTTGTPMPLTMEEELSATRWAIRGRSKTL